MLQYRNTKFQFYFGICWAESSLTDKELLNQFKAIEKMPEAKRSVVKEFLDAFITKDKLRKLAV